MSKTECLNDGDLQHEVIEQVCEDAARLVVHESVGEKSEIIEQQRVLILPRPPIRPRGGSELTGRPSRHAAGRIKLMSYRCWP